MQQGAKTLKKLGIALEGISSTIHLSLLPDGELIGAYGREWRQVEDKLDQKLGTNLRMWGQCTESWHPER